MTWRPGPWATALPENYFSEMEVLLRDLLINKWRIPEDELPRTLARHLFGRMEITQERFIPWMQAAIPSLKTKRVLEIGCGNASITAPMAMASRYVTAFDLPSDNHAIAVRRCELLGINNVTIQQHGVEWIDEYVGDAKALFGEVDVILCHAVLEHLTIIERLRFLGAAWRHLSIGGYLIVMEAHNRLYWFDWHSSRMPFFDQLPDELAHLWITRSRRATVPENIKAYSVDQLEKVDRDGLYRFGRGVSFHEFYISINASCFEVANPWLIDRTAYLGWNETYIKVLEEQLSKVDPPVHRAFGQPSLDLILKKTCN